MFEWIRSMFADWKSLKYLNEEKNAIILTEKRKRELRDDINKNMTKTMRKYPRWF